MDRWVHMDPSSFEFQHYYLISSTFEAFGYRCLGHICPVATSKESLDIKIGYYEKARNISKAIGDKFQVKHMTDFIDRALANFDA